MTTARRSFRLHSVRDDVYDKQGGKEKMSRYSSNPHLLVTGVLKRCSSSWNFDGRIVR